MNFQDWSNKTGILPTHPTTERQAISVICDHMHPNRAELWRLSDYKVSATCGIVVWLTPCNKPPCEPKTRYYYVQWYSKMAGGTCHSTIETKDTPQQLLADMSEHFSKHLTIIEFETKEEMESYWNLAQSFQTGNLL